MAQPKLMEFVSKTCPNCAVQKKRQVMEKLAEAFPDITFERIDSDVRPKLADKHEVQAIPCYVLLDADGEELFNENGAMPIKKLEELIKEALADGDEE